MTIRLAPAAPPSLPDWIARLTDSAPQDIPTKLLRTICAWHRDFDPTDPANAGASTGICHDCQLKVDAYTDRQHQTFATPRVNHVLREMVDTVQVVADEQGAA